MRGQGAGGPAARGSVLAAGGSGAEFSAVANGVEEAAVAGGAGVTAGDLLAKAGLEEADAAAGGALFSPFGLQFCGCRLRERGGGGRGKGLVLSRHTRNKCV